MSRKLGLAWATTNKGIVWHAGGTGGYRSFLGFTADRKRGVVVLTNNLADPDDLGFATLNSDAPLAPAYKAIVLPGASLDGYVGTYELAENFLVYLRRINRRALRPGHQDKVRSRFFRGRPTNFSPRSAGSA